MTRINNALDGIGEKISRQSEKLENLYKQVKTAQEEAAKPFPREEELQEKLAKLSELNIALNLEGSGIEAGDITGESPAAEAARGTPQMDEKNEKQHIIEQAKLKLGSNSIVTDAQKCRAYSGDVLEIGEGYAVQKISRGAGVVHSFGKVPELREMLESHGKENLCVAYDKSGKCSVTPKINGQERETAVSY
jgi:hypothetical protein